MMFRKFYSCPSCGNEWTDTWDCLCNDRSPCCNIETEPHDFEELEDDDET